MDLIQRALVTVHINELAQRFKTYMTRIETGRVNEAVTKFVTSVYPTTYFQHMVFQRNSYHMFELGAYDYGYDYGHGDVYVYGYGYVNGSVNFVWNNKFIKPSYRYTEVKNKQT